MQQIRSQKNGLKVQERKPEAQTREYAEPDTKRALRPHFPKMLKLDGRELKIEKHKLELRLEEQEKELEVRRERVRKVLCTAWLLK